MSAGHLATYRIATNNSADALRTPDGNRSCSFFLGNRFLNNFIFLANLLSSRSLPSYNNAQSTSTATEDGIPWNPQVNSIDCNFYPSLAFFFSIIILTYPIYLL